MKLHTIFILLLGTFSIFTIHAQQEYRLSLEAGGKAFLFGSLSVESYWEKPQIGIGAGLGFNSVENFDFMSLDSSINKMVNYRVTEVRIPLTAYVYKTFGKGKNRLIIPLGYSSLSEVGWRSSSEDTQWDFQFIPLPFAGAGWESRGERFIFRLPLYVLYLGEDPSGIFPSVFPWLGLGITLRLGKS